MVRYRGVSRRGVAAVEFAFVIPVLLAFMLGIWEVGRMIEVQQVVSNAAREAGRQAATGSYTNDQIISNTRDYLRRAGLPDAAATNATIHVTNQTSGKDAASADYLDHFTITIAVNYSEVRWSSLDLFANASTKINGSADWNSTEDLPVSVSTAIPLQ